ncbi:hypothetical protein F5Y14DRAFT_442354 [Nemania sp. NC0429]|nr:hypothetical protein F5Y14DRAFT_442354 [Nemania sp. NC0429]
MSRAKSRNRLQADIQAASQTEIPHIHGIGRGDVQDEFIFTFTHPQIPRGEIEIRVMPQDAAGYPRENCFLVYTNEGISSNVSSILDDAMTSTTSMCIADLLRALSRRLCNSLDSTSKKDDDEDNVAMTDAHVGTYSLDLSDDSDSDIPFEEDDDDGDFSLTDERQYTAPKNIPDDILQKIRQDFKAVRDAGFRVGNICHIEHVSAYSIMAMSIKACKLGFSSETHIALNLEPSDYVVLLMKYSGGYVSFEDALTRPAGQISLEFRLRKCAKYRPTPDEAIASFSSSHTANQPYSPRLLPFGVGTSIDLLLNGSFISMVKLRRIKNISWDDAKWLHSQVARHGWDTESIIIPAPSPRPTGGTDTNLPPILMSDHLSSGDPVSLPLVAMQFALRYLIKCRDYCMICHAKIAENFEALKPYVCGNPLCLFQYMSLGLGPSIDHEIINQEHVVDLLVSFCFASLYYTKAEKPKLREFPSGLNLQVPCVRRLEHNNLTPGGYTVPNYGALVDPLEIEVFWSDSKATITDRSYATRPDLTAGQWVVIHTSHAATKGGSASFDLEIFHWARIEAAYGSELLLHIASRHPVPMVLEDLSRVVAHDWDNTRPTFGRLVLCNQSLDELESSEDKAFSLRLLLLALPSVTEMRTYLIGNQSRQLATWNRIPSAAMKLLRWIIASNRSFIIQLENPPSQEFNPADPRDKRPDRSHERISGLDGWMQFRFAQGSPEKEALFLSSLREVTKPHRTLLAWHGSAIGNWHSIIREGLDFKVTTNGRAYGNGVYFSRSFDYSLNYTTAFGLPLIWPHSSLQITQAISLNELVNLPHKFQHSVSCYVVDVLHWIQCRYLFIRPRQPEISPATPKRTNKNRVEEFEQDPNYAITGPKNEKVFIPRIAIPSLQQPRHPVHSIPRELDRGRGDDTDDEDIDDVNFLACKDRIQSHSSGAELSMSLFPRTQTYEEPQTDFRPGTLDFSKLPQFAVPSYATKPAQQTIQRELQKLEKVQSSTPLHELGWYLHIDKIDNMFQWIVELHSFDPTLPLAKDMKAAGITSIVLEIRFLRGFPLTPPFIRVIQPRFLPFANGGGGHVTAGGAMCMELLTNTGWSPVSSMESVLLQVRLAMCNLEPKPARLAKSTGDTTGGSRILQYSIREAVEAYMRAAALHRWEVPTELKEIAMN